MPDMTTVTLAVHANPASMKALNPELAHLADDQIGLHFARCARVGICPWAMASERVEHCDLECGPVSGCRMEREIRANPSS